MQVDINGCPYWIAPSGKNYAFPKSYLNDNLIEMLQHLVEDGFLVTYNMIKIELKLI